MVSIRKRSSSLLQRPSFLCPVDRDSRDAQVVRPVRRQVSLNQRRGCALRTRRLFIAGGDKGKDELRFSASNSYLSTCSLICGPALLCAASRRSTAEGFSSVSSATDSQCQISILLHRPTIPYCTARDFTICVAVMQPTLRKSNNGPLRLQKVKPTVVLLFLLTRVCVIC